MIQIVEQTLDKLLSGELNDYLPNKEAYFVERHRSGFIKDKIQDYRDPENRLKIIERFKEAEVVGDCVVLYRGMSHDMDIKLEKTGICWTFAEEKAYCYGTKDTLPFYYVYKALVPFSSVQWSHTLQKGMVMHSHEKEFRLIEGSPIKVIKVEKKIKTICTLLETFNEEFNTTV